MLKLVGGLIALIVLGGVGLFVYGETQPAPQRAIEFTVDAPSK
ncbi:MAG: hypothetical protein AAGH48_01990 [Pseudomonadota bacterium]